MIAMATKAQRATMPMLIQAALRAPPSNAIIVSVSSGPPFGAGTVPVLLPEARRLMNVL
jgi:hypothetical protein